MIIEHALFTVAADGGPAFEAAFQQAHGVITKAPGCHWAELHRGVEHPNTYLLRAGWDTVEAHMTDFRESALYQEWRALIHHHVVEPAQVLHYQPLAD